MSDSEPLPKKLARMNRLTDKLESEGELSDEEWEQLRNDREDTQEAVSNAIEPLVEAYTDMANSIVESLQPVVETLQEVERTEQDND